MAHSDRHELISIVAYHLWMTDGMREGESLRYWLAAESMILGYLKSRNA